MWETGAQFGNEEAIAWWEKFRALGQMLGVSVPGGAGHHPPSLQPPVAGGGFPA